MKKMMILGCLILFLESIILISCATVPTGPPAPGELRLLRMQVPGTIRSGEPYEVLTTFGADGKPQIKKACFRWSGEGPYCFKVENVKFETPGTFTVRLRTNNPGSYRLDGYAEYVRDGKTRMTNEVGSQIYVR